MTKIKIAVTGTRGFPGVQGGVETHCEKLYLQLAAMGCDITVFSRKPYVGSQSCTHNGVLLIPIGCPRNKFLEAIVHTFKSVIKARKLHPDILHIHAIGPSFFAPLGRILGMRVVITNHGPDYERQKWSMPAKLFLLLCERIGMTFANEVITIARNIADDVKRKYGRESTVIPNGVEIPSLSDKDGFLDTFKVQRHKYILAVGRFVPEKGFDVLVEAFNKGNFNDWKLVIVGDADHEDIFSRTLKSSVNKNRNIILTGFLTGQPLHQLYSYAGLFVLPSYHEGLPIVLLEAMSYGLSCIASNIPANKNVELEGDRFFQSGDVDALTAKMKEYVSKSWADEDRIKQVNMIAEKYDWKTIAEETFKIYREVAS